MWIDFEPLIFVKLFLLQMPQGLSLAIKIISNISEYIDKEMFSLHFSG